MHFRTILVVALLLLWGCCGDENIDGILQGLQKYCPYYGFEGTLQCPSSVSGFKSAKYVREGATDSYIRSGLGYDRVTREIRFPVLPSSAPANSVSQQYQTYRYTDVNQYIDAVYSEKSYYSGGLFVLEDSFVNQFAAKFGDYRLDMTVTQKLFNNYATQITSRTVIPEFLEILQTLPTSYNPNDPNVVNLYRTRIINIFGTDVSTSSTHGGVFFQQTTVKSCYSGNVAPDMQHEMDTTLAKQPPGSLPYLAYRSLGVFDVKGGNPEIPHSQYPQLIASFPQDPAITQFNSIPIWQVVPPQYQAAVQAAIAHYTNDNQVQLNNLITSLETQKVNSYKAPQTVFVYGAQTEQLWSPIIHWPNCPFLREGKVFYTPRCSVILQSPSMNSGQVTTIGNEPWYLGGSLHFEVDRDVPSGQQRILGSYKPTFEGVSTTNFTNWPIIESNSTKIERDFWSALYVAGGKTMTTGWQHTGCVSFDHVFITAHPAFKTYFTVCIDCLPVITTSPAKYGLKHSDLQCVCPGF